MKKVLIIVSIAAVLVIAFYRAPLVRVPTRYCIPEQTDPIYACHAWITPHQYFWLKKLQLAEPGAV